MGKKSETNRRMGEILVKKNIKNILINYLGRNNAGPAFAIEISKSLIGLGYRVYAVISKYISNYSEWEKIGAESIYEVETFSSKFDLVYKTTKFYVLERKKIKNYFKDVHIDLIICPMCHVWSNGINKLFPNVRVVAYAHEPNVRLGISKAEMFLWKRFYKKADDIVAMTKSFIPIIKEKYHKTSEHIYYSRHGSFDYYKSCYTDNSLNIFFDSGKVNFIFFGRIEKSKGIDILVKSFQILEKKYNNISLIIAGKGNLEQYKTEIQKLKNVVVINRYIKDSEISQIFSGPNLISVLPYLDASQSGVISVAMEYEVPLIVTDVGGLKEQLYDGDIGVFCKPGDVLSLAKAMERFLKEPELYMRQKSAITEKLYDLKWDNIIKILMDEISRSG